MNWRNISTVYLKELTDALRDRRTLIFSLAVPCLVMPGIMFGFGALMYKVVKKAEKEVPSVMILGGEDSPALRNFLTQRAEIKVVPSAPDYVQQISDRRLRTAVDIPVGFEAALAQGEQKTVKVYLHDGDINSGHGAAELERLLQMHRQELVRGKLAELHLPDSFVKPYEIQRQNVASAEKVGGATFGGVIPYVLILLAFTGAMYPAIDTTAGEKERGTLETILCSPVGRTDLVAGKFLMVLTASLVTVVCSLVSMGMAAMVGGSLLGGRGMAGGAAAGGGIIPSFDPVGLIAVVGLVIPLAVFFSAALFSVALFAKSHKEAQSLVSPMIFVVILPAMVGMLPGVELNAKLALVPILNVALASKEMVSGNFPLGLLALIFGSSCLYAAVMLGVAVKLFNRESVIFRT